MTNSWDVETRTMPIISNAFNLDFFLGVRGGKLSRALQTKHLNLSLISSLVDANS